MSISVGSVSVDIVPDATRFRSEMNSKLKDLTASVRVTLNDKAFEAEIAKATRDRVVNVKVDDKGSIDKVTRGSHALLTTLTLLAPTAAPLSAVAIGAGTALAGLGATGILAVKGISAEMKAGTPVGQRYTTMLGGLKTELGGLERIAAQGVLPGVEGSVMAVSQSMPELRREVGLLSTSIGSDLEPITRGILGLFQDLFPTTQTIAGGIHTLALDFEDWANGAGGRSFAAYLAKELPVVASTLASIGTAGAHVVQALLPLGDPVLKGIQGISTVIAHIPVGVVQALFQAFASYKAITLTAAAIDAVTLATKRLGIAQGTAGVTGIGGIGKGKAIAGLGIAGMGVGGLIGAVGAGLNPDELQSPYQRAQANFQTEHPTAGPKGFQDFVKSAASDPKAAAQLKEYASQSYKAKAAQDSLGGSVGTTTTKIAAETAATTAWATALDDAFTKASGVKSAQIGVSQAIADATTSLKENGRTLDLHTQKGRNNATALLNVATAEHNKIDADVAGSASQRTINNDFEDGRNKLIHLAEKFGASKTAAKKYADELLGIPPLVKTKIETPGLDAAILKAQSLGQTLRANSLIAARGYTNGNAYGTGSTTTGATGGYVWGGAIHRSVGGPVWGAGTATSDSVRAYLSNGEFVVKAATVKSVGVPFLNQLNATGATPASVAAGAQITQIINPQAGQSEYEIATIAARQLMFALVR